MNNPLQNIFFQLLRLGLWGQGTLITDRPLSDEDWSQIYTAAVKRTVEGLIYDSFTLLPEEQLPSQSLRLKWAIRIDQIERHNSKMNTTIAMLHRMFSEAGLQPILQKGQGVANCYRIPLHRISGDIDWYFDHGGYAHARDLLKKEQLIFEDTAGFSLNYLFNSIDIEHHKKLFDIRNPFKRNYLKKIQEQYSNHCQYLHIAEQSIRLLSPELQLLQVNTHILKHLITFGIGLRQFCDSARLYHTLSSNIRPDTLKKIYQTLGILPWAHALHYLLVKYLGLRKEELPFSYPIDLKVDWIMEEVWYAGNFGYHDERFEGDKISSLSVHPKGANRLWTNFKRYYKYAPMEVLFYPLEQLYSSVIGIDRD
ncbi:nucleotidyltransferase family protein [Sphingobacterium siyangense]|uniref:nucleotidyltransferase family protein n=1 Tax=Sphingobacterium siyangense TaxID=459529 RepID=UPI003DA3C609